MASGDKKEGQDSGLGRSSYYLSSGDNPGQILTTVHLKGENYDEWARIFRGALRAKGKTAFIDGTIERPSKTEELELWYMVNSMVVSWIFHTIYVGVRSTITYVDEAKTLWDDLKQRFSLGNGLRVQQIKSDLANCKQAKNECVAAFFGRMKKLWDELNDLDRLPICSCTGCKCGLSAKLILRQEEERVHQFVIGLETPDFENVSSTIFNTEPLPNLNKAYSNVIREDVFE